MFVVARKDQPRTGETPTLLYGYGGKHPWARQNIQFVSCGKTPCRSSPERSNCEKAFVCNFPLPLVIHFSEPWSSEGNHLIITGFNISLEPGFSVSRLCFMLAYNGTYAVANLRQGPHILLPQESGLTPSAWPDFGTLRSPKMSFWQKAAMAAGQ